MKLSVIDNAALLILWTCLRDIGGYDNVKAIERLLKALQGMNRQLSEIGMGQDDGVRVAVRNIRAKLLTFLLVDRVKVATPWVSVADGGDEGGSRLGVGLSRLFRYRRTCLYENPLHLRTITLSFRLWNLVYCDENGGEVGVMPVFKIDKSIVYFAHVPKCAGSSVEEYIMHRFNNLSMFDVDFRRLGRNGWYISPQHLHVEALNRIFRLNFFDFTFAVVRHPLTRFISAYNHAVRLHAISWLENPTAFWMCRACRQLNRDLDFVGRDPLAEVHIREYVTRLTKERNRLERGREP